MLKSRRAGNPGLRMVPEMSKQSARASKTTAPDDSAEESVETAEETPAINYAETSKAILQALRKIEKNVKLTRKERGEARQLLSDGEVVATKMACYSLVLIGGIMVGMYLRPHRRGV